MERAKSRGSNIVVVGGGIVGSSCAMALLATGHGVTLVSYDPGEKAASWGNAGHIAVEQTEPLASIETICSAPRRLLSRDGALALPLRDIGAWLPFAVRMISAARPASFVRGQAALAGLLADAMGAWERYARAIGDDTLLVRDGHFIVWDTPESADAGIRYWRSKACKGVHFRELSHAERHQISSLLGHEPGGAIRCEGSGSIAGPDLIEQAFTTRFAQLGGRSVRGWAELDVEGNRVAVSVPGVGRIDADQVVVAGGVASRRLMERLGFRVPMIAERGYHVRAPGAQWPRDLPPVVFEDRSMIVTRFRDSVRASSFVEFSRQHRSPDRRKWSALRRRISELNLPFEMPGETWIGSRPTLPDYLPAIGRSPHHANLIYAFGHQHLGLTLGPLTGEIVSRLAGREETPADLGPFDIERFGRWSARRQRNRINRL